MAQVHADPDGVPSSGTEGWDGSTLLSNNNIINTNKCVFSKPRGSTHVLCLSVLARLVILILDSPPYTKISKPQGMERTASREVVI